MYQLILLITGFAAGCLLFCALPSFKTIKGSASAPKISVVIPARNEADKIAHLISDLKKQTLAPFEIICADDESTDRTASIAEAAGARVIKAKPRPTGWVGKTWACQNGAEAAKGELLLFLDADVRLSPQALAKLATLYFKRGGVVSVQPYHTVKKFYEHFSMFFNMVALAATGLGLPFVRRTVGLFGPVLLISRELYLKHKGHETVKSKVLEDFNLGKYYAARQISISLCTGKPDICYRMYGASFKELWEGWTKNFFSGSISISLIRLLPVFVWITAMTDAFLSLAIEAASGGRDLWLCIAFYFAFAAQVLFYSKKAGNFSALAALFFPVFLLGFHIIFLASVVKRLFFRRVKWKGRIISTKED